MNELDERPLVRSSVPEPDQDAAASTRTGDSRLYIAVGVAALLLGGAGAWWWTRGPEPAPASAPRTGTEGVVQPAAEVARPLPPLGQMDTFLRALIGALSSNPQMARWLATDDLIRQMADGIDKISRGQSPSVAVLKPQDTFEILGSRQQLRIDPRTYRRYDSLAAAVSSLHPTAVADAYKTIHPRLDEAYRKLGRSENSVDEAFTVALDMLLATPEVRDPVRLVHGQGATYAFAEPRLEALAPVQKQLIRMGPENSGIIRARLREIADALTASTKPSGGTR
jgi:hypothetical protein